MTTGTGLVRDHTAACACGLEREMREIRALIDRTAEERLTELLGITARIADLVAFAETMPPERWLSRAKELVRRDLAQVLHRELDGWEALLRRMEQLEGRAERRCARHRGGLPPIPAAAASRPDAALS